MSAQAGSASWVAVLALVLDAEGAVAHLREADPVDGAASVDVAFPLDAASHVRDEHHVAVLGDGDDDRLDGPFAALVFDVFEMLLEDSALAALVCRDLQVRQTHGEGRLPEMEVRDVRGFHVLVAGTRQAEAVDAVRLHLGERGGEFLVLGLGQPVDFLNPVEEVMDDLRGALGRHEGRFFRGLAGELRGEGRIPDGVGFRHGLGLAVAPAVDGEGEARPRLANHLDVHGRSFCHRHDFFSPTYSAKGSSGAGASHSTQVMT
jgi:hypothetical protein